MPGVVDCRTGHPDQGTQRVDIRLQFGQVQQQAGLTVPEDPRLLLAGHFVVDRNHAHTEPVQGEPVQEELGPVLQHQRYPVAAAVACPAIAFPEPLDPRAGLPVGQFDRAVGIIGGGLRRNVQEDAVSVLYCGGAKDVVYGVHPVVPPPVTV